MFNIAKQHLEKYYLENRIIEFPVSTATVYEAANALNCTEGEIAKSLAFYLNEKLETKDFSTFIVRYDIANNGINMGVFPWLSFGVVTTGGQKTNLGVTFNYSEDPYTGASRYNVNYGNGSNSYSEFDSISFIYYIEGTSSKIYVYVNDEYLTEFTLDAVPSYLEGVYVQYSHGSSGDSAASFDSIEFFGVSSDYSGDLYDVLEENAPLTDSEDFNTIIINGQKAE